MHRLSMALVTACLAFAVLGSARAADKTYAIVVGYNGAIDGGAALEFADDDALKWSELLGMFVDEVTLLTEIDGPSASQWGFRDHGLSVARPPTRTQLRAAFERYNHTGARIIYVHVAHGLRDNDQRGGEGYVKMAPDPLADPAGRLYRSDLRRELIDRLAPGARLDLIIDACDAYYLLQRGEDHAAQVAAVLADDLTTRPDVGVILATRGAWKVNESKELQGSYFSLVLRSALLGAADPDLGGVVNYSHLATTLRIAGRTENRPQERFEPWISPPNGNWGTPMVDWRAAGPPALTLGPEVTGHVQLYDSARGLWASFGKARGHELKVRGVKGRSYHVYPKLEEAGWIWRADRHTRYSALTQRTPFVAMARGDAPSSPIYEGLLHCKIFEGYALASNWPAPTCEQGTLGGAKPLRARIGIGYQLADAPFQRLALSHGLALTADLPLSSRARLIGTSRIELAHESGAAPYETIWGFGLGAGLELTAHRVGPLELGVAATLGWAPVFLEGARDKARWADGYVETGLVARVWLSSLALVITPGVSFDIRSSTETTAIDLRWSLRLALEFGT